MTLTIYALDTQFAAATDGNVNNGPGTSTFDYPPNSTSNLVIESQPGDPTPYMFSPGDTYTLTFQGNGGTTIQNAVVIRSDPISLGGDDGWAVVFEGTDPSGDLVQVVWTPEFDLEQWYWDNFSGGNPPGFYTTDANAASYATPCFAPETPVETEHGPSPAGEIVAGMRLMTRDRGLQPVLWVARTNVIGRSRAAPVWIAPGVLGNSVPLALSQQHRVLLTGSEVRAAHGVDEVLAPAQCLLNGATVRLDPRPRIGYVHLLMERHEVLTAGGAGVESLHLGPEARLLLSRVESAPPPRLLARPAPPRAQAAEPAGWRGAVAGDLRRGRGETGDVRTARRRTRRGPQRLCPAPWPARAAAALSADRRGGGIRRSDAGPCGATRGLTASGSGVGAISGADHGGAFWTTCRGKLPGQLAGADRRARSRGQITGGRSPGRSTEADHQSPLTERSRGPQARRGPSPPGHWGTGPAPRARSRAAIRPTRNAGPPAII